MKKSLLAILCVSIFVVTAQAAEIQVTAPAMGASWKIGSTQTVQWTFSDIGAANEVHVVLLQNGTNLGKIAENVDIGADGHGSFSWSVGSVIGSPAATAGSGYTIKVRRANDAAVFGISAAFSLTSGSGLQAAQLQSDYALVKKSKPEIPSVTGATVQMLQVSAPPAGAALDPTGTAKIAWKFVNIPESDVSISLVRAGQPDQLLFGSITAGHEFTWDLNSSLPDPGSCRIAVETLDKAHRGLSGAFAIRELGQIEPLFPIQDMTIPDHTSLDVQWKRVGNIQKVDLVLKKTDYSWQKVLAIGVDAKLEKQNVTFNFEQYGQFVIEFNYTVDGAIVNVGTGVFTIYE